MPTAWWRRDRPRCTLRHKTGDMPSSVCSVRAPAVTQSEVLLTLAAAERLATADTVHSCACVAIISALSRIPRARWDHHITSPSPPVLRVFESDT
jgi:hypothetical protein